MELEATHGWQEVESEDYHLHRFEHELPSSDYGGMSITISIHYDYLIKWTDFAGQSVTARYGSESQAGRTAQFLLDITGMMASWSFME